MSADTDDFTSTRRIGNVTVSLELEMSGPSTIDLNVDETTWRKALPELADAEWVPFSMSSAVIQSGQATLVIDPLIDEPGSRLRNEVEDDYRHWSSSPGLRAGLERLGVANDAVTHVVITHAHFDHCLGLTIEQHGEYRPRFPNARHYLGAADWLEPEERPAVPPPDADTVFFRWTFEEMWPRLDEIQRAGLLELIEGPTAIAPGITLLPAPGESPGHHIVRGESDGESIYHLGDLVHYWFELAHMGWIISESEGRDLQAMIASRRDLLPRIAAEQAIVTFSHAEFPGWGRIVEDGDWVRWERIPLLQIDDLERNG